MEIKWGGLAWIAGIVLGCSLLLIAFILGCYSTYWVNHYPGSPLATLQETPIATGTYEIQVQYYAPGNAVTQFTVTATVGSYKYSALSNGYRVLTFSPFSYVFSKIPMANQVTFALVNPSPALGQLAGIQATPLVTTPYVVKVSSTTYGPYYTVSVGASATNCVVRFFPVSLGSVTTPLTISVDTEIRFVVGLQA